MNYTYLYDALIDHPDVGVRTGGGMTVPRVRARIGTNTTGGMAAEIDGQLWEITPANIVKRFPSVKLSDELRAELRRHGVAQVEVASVEVQGDGLVPKWVIRVQMKFRPGARMPDAATADRLNDEVMSEAETELDSTVGESGTPTGHWTIPIS